VAGHKGLVGSAIVRCLKNNGYNNIIERTRKELDLLEQNATEYFFKNEKPDLVIIAAAKVGGIFANSTQPAEFLYQNLMIQNNIIYYSHKYNVKKLLFLGSACIYPKLANQPIVENELLSGFLEPTNEAYAIAKIAGIKLCEGYFNQYDKNFLSLMPNNLYGPNDNFDLVTSHVIPALMNKFHTAKQKSKKSVTIWGTGNPLREFLHVDDLANAILFVMEKINAKEIYEKGISHINVGSGFEISIRDLAIIIKEVTGFNGELYFDISKPDGTPRKLLDDTILKQKGWHARISLHDGLRDVYSWFQKNN
tara:strand:+ start:6400 stop:7323 length:924 start_codon:yes stop_codon:yes gene_type:complete